MTIAAAVLEKPNAPFVIEWVQLEGPRANEVLVKIAASGVCHSDWHLVTGATKHSMPVVAGHEGAGIVHEIGAGVVNLRVGDHVILNWAPSCGSCFYCSRGKPNLCDTYTAPIWAGTMLDGTTRLKRRGRDLHHYCGLASFAEYAVVPAESCVAIQRDVPLEVAALIGCAISTGVGAAMYTAGVRSGETIAVIGCGGVGLSIIQGAALCGASTIIAVDTNRSKLDIATKFGATETVTSGETAAEEVRAMTNGRGVDHAFEAVGVPRLQEQAFDMARSGGTITLAGLSPMGTATNLPGALITRQEKTIKGSYYGSIDARRDFPMLVDLYKSGKLKLNEMISRRYRLDEINEAFEQMLKGDTARGVILM